ncbi:hypothetical protein IJJ08_04165 [bacterium]|nr:hypothetical protein [bacterium]
MKHVETADRVERLAALLAADYAANCTGPVWRGSKGEKQLRGVSREQLIGEGYTPSQAQAMVVDLANTAYEDLPEHWQETNRVAARDLFAVVEQLGEDAIRQADLTDADVRAQFGDIVHENWLAHNEWARGGDLDKPFALLPVVEQDKDIAQIRILKKVLG